MPKNTITTTTKLKVQVPTVPNFLAVHTGNTRHTNSIAVHQLSDADLRRIGQAWTDKLIERARLKRT